MTNFRRAALIYNPAAGQRHALREQQVRTAAEVLRASGIEVELIPTRAARSGGHQAQEAIASGCDLILAAGGDGTVHDVLQGVVATSVPLGVVPLGTANALACDLRLPRDPGAAAKALLSYTPQRIAAGRLEFQNSDGAAQSRYFTVMGGVGMDALMLYHLNAQAKQRWGMWAYHAVCWKLCMTRRFPFFEAECVDKSTGERRIFRVTQAMAVRINNFGGVLRRMAPGAELHSDSFQAVLFATANRFSYVSFLTANFAGRQVSVPGIELLHTDEILCRPLKPAPKSSHRIYAEADGEFLGSMPARMTIVRDAFSLLMPQTDVIGASSTLPITH
jgi:diacylglycerol kinase family enzyme